jgi:hypothetical protein
MNAGFFVSEQYDGPWIGMVHIPHYLQTADWHRAELENAALPAICIKIPQWR